LNLLVGKSLSNGVASPKLFWGSQSVLLQTSNGNFVWDAASQSTQWNLGSWPLGLPPGYANVFKSSCDNRSTVIMDSWMFESISRKTLASCFRETRFFDRIRNGSMERWCGLFNSKFQDASPLWMVPKVHFSKCLDLLRISVSYMYAKRH